MAQTETTLARRCLALSLRPRGKESSARGPLEDPRRIFVELVRENAAQCPWNPALARAICALRYQGHVLPSTLLASGSDYCLETVRSAWERRTLRPPKGFDIQAVGDVECITMAVSPQSQFAPLSDCLCKVIYELNEKGRVATEDAIASRLRTSFPGLVFPGREAMARTLGRLVRERTIRGVRGVRGVREYVVEPYPPGSNRHERPLLLSNDEALARLHGAPSPDCLRRSHSLRLLRSRIAPDSPPSDTEEPYKKEKSPSVFSRWFSRRNKGGGGDQPKMTKTHSATLSPGEWSDAASEVRSCATQTTREPEETRNKRRSSSLGRDARRSPHRERRSSQPREASVADWVLNGSAWPRNGGGTSKEYVVRGQDGSTVVTRTKGGGEVEVEVSLTTPSRRHPGGSGTPGKTTTVSTVTSVRPKERPATHPAVKTKLAEAKAAFFSDGVGKGGPQDESGFSSAHSTLASELKPPRAKPDLDCR